MTAVPSPVSWRWRIPALGFGQIIAWGALFYSVAVLADSMARDLGLSRASIFAAFTASLVVSGLVAPLAGRLIDGGRGRGVLAASALLGATGFAVLSLATGEVGLVGAWLVLGLAMGGGLYDAAFAVLHRMVPAPGYRRAVTALTLFGGFASTVFWPLSRLLLEHGGWRFATGCFAALELLVCLPLYLLALPRGARMAVETRAVHPAGPALSGLPRRRFRWLAGAFALASFVVAVLSAHLITLLGMGGLSIPQAIAIGSLFGPMQVLARSVEYLFARRLSARLVGSLSFAAQALALCALLRAGTDLAGAVLFALLYGASNGLMTIIRGTVPAQLFAGVPGFGALLGQLALPAFIAKAGAPFAFALLLEWGGSRTLSAGLLLAISLLAWSCYERACRMRD